MPEGACGLPELVKFQNVLPDYQIKVLTLGRPHMVTYAGPLSESGRRILLIQDNEHFDGCTSFGAFLNKSYFCHDCNSGFDRDTYDAHPCNKQWCRSCYSRDCPDYLDLKDNLPPGQYPLPSIDCDLCHRQFFGSHCLATHNQRGETRPNKSLCDRIKTCPTCRKTYDVKFSHEGVRYGHRHKCGWGTCEHCEQYVDVYNHLCFIQPLAEDEDDPLTKKVPLDTVGRRTITGSEEPDQNGCVEVAREPPLLVYADYEAITDAEGFQSPILLGYETVDSDTTHLLYGPNCTQDFINRLEDLAVDSEGDDRNVIILFHNLKGYDGMFLLQFMYNNHREVTRLITVGAKVFSFQSDRLTFKDSLCFLSFPPSSFSATFGLTELHKGYFPHLFNTLDNQNYEGPLPDVRFYDPDGMSQKKKEHFLLWHANKIETQYTFNLKEDMKKYCKSDVKLLKAGCEAFAVQFEEEAGFNPFIKCITIASACNRYWHKKHLAPETFAIEPPNGWKGSQTNQSFSARQWLTWLNFKLDHENPHLPELAATADRIRHVHNGGEVRIGGVLVDGYDVTTNTVYEFNGCFFHGCPRCFPDSRHITSRLRSDRTLQECYESTQTKQKKLLAANFSVVTKWECDWNEDKQTLQELKNFLDTHEFVQPLQPRDAFFGGRTNAVTLHKTADPNQNETIHYQDVTSLYPWVNKYAEYPVGHPQIHTNIPHRDITQYFGIAKVTLLPPYNLFHPVLSHRQEGKLTFPLCRTCVSQEMAKPLLDRSAVCRHDSDDRQLLGTWCTPELEEAINQGYVIQTIHEVWHFPPSQRKRGLFANYVNTWLKIKTESSGYPSWADNPEKRTQYVANYLQCENIELDPAFIAKNPGRKATAKLMLNSFWGKFGENLRKSNTTPITTPNELYQILSDLAKEIQHLRICTKDQLEVIFTTSADEYIENGRTNLFVAAFTTCHARLKLYTYLKQLQQQVLYFDTDSVIYSYTPGDPHLSIGDYLGDLTNELEDGDHIVDFSSGGPKNYGYKTRQGKIECKVRGFTLGNVRGAFQLNYNILRQNVLDELTDPQDRRRDIPVVNPHFFTRNPATKQLRVSPRTKEYGLVFDKCVVDPRTFKSFPYGYHRTAPLDDDEFNTTPSGGDEVCMCSLFEGETCRLCSPSLGSA